MNDHLSYSYHLPFNQSPKFDKKEDLKTAKTGLKNEETSVEKVKSKHLSQEPSTGIELSKKNFEKLEEEPRVGAAIQTIFPYKQAERFKFKKAAKVILLNPINLKTFAKSTTYKILSLLIMGTYILSKPFSKKVRAGEETFATKLKFKAKVLSATKFSYKMSKIFHCWGRKTFGDQLLVTAKNVANPEVLRNKEDRAEALKMVGDLLELNLRDNLTQNSRDNLSKKKINVTKDDGECFGTSLHFISNVLNLDEMDETKIVDLANQYREGVPARAAANQTLYEAIRVKTTQESVNKFLGALRRDQKRPILNCNFDYVRNKSEFLFERLKNSSDLELKELERFVSTNVFLDLQEKDDIEKALIKKWIKIILEFRFGTSSSSQDKEEKEIRNLIESLRLSFEDDESKRYTARLNGLVEDENAKINEKISNAYTFSSTEEQLKDFNDLPTGAYTLGFDTWFLKDQGHAIAYVKTDKGSYLFDPNYGLIKCGQDPRNDLMKLMYLYPERPKQAKEAVTNYHLEILKFEKDFTWR